MKRRGPVRGPHFNDFVSEKQIGKSEVITWRNGGFDLDGIDLMREEALECGDDTFLRRCR